MKSRLLLLLLLLSRGQPVWRLWPHTTTVRADSLENVIATFSTRICNYG